MKFRKKPVEVNAVRVTKEWFDGNHPNPIHIKDRRVITHPLRHVVEIETLEGKMIANEGDWIITGVKGEVYPCKPDIFMATYEPVE